MGGKHYPRSMLFIDWGSGLPADPFNGARRPLGHTGTLAAPLRGRPLCGARPHSVRALHPILWPHRWVGWGGGIGGRPPWAHPLVLHASRNPALFLLLFSFFFYPCYWVEWGCFNPGLIPGVALRALICNTPSGNEPLPDWHPESASRL